MDTKPVIKVSLTVPELQELISGHHSAAIEAAQAGKIDKMRYHESRRAYLIEIANTTLVETTLNSIP